MDELFDAFGGETQDSSAVINANDKPEDSRVDVRYSKKVTTVTSADKVKNYTVKQWPTLDEDSGVISNALGISLESIERHRAQVREQQLLAKQEAQKEAMSMAHEVLETVLEETQSDEQNPSITVEELDKIRADAYEEGKASGLKDGYEQGIAQGIEEGKKQGYEEGFANGQEKGYKDGLTQGTEDGFVQGHKEGLDSGQKIVIEQAERFRYLADALANPLREVDKDVTDEIAYIISRLVKVITKKEIKQNADFLVKSIQNAISILPNAQKGAKISLNPEDLAIVTASLGPEYIKKENYQLIEDPTLEIGDIKVSNDESLIDWRINDRIDSLLEDYLVSVYPAVEQALREPLEGCPEYDAVPKKKVAPRNLSDIKDSLMSSANPKVQDAPLDNTNEAPLDGQMASTDANAIPDGMAEEQMPADESADPQYAQAEPVDLPQGQG
ncbi:MAG: hypothetical protein GX278_02645 [Aeromonadales bacterium]|nr:hypothetical protein [Aeromonadales bacterium]